jgi:hypothetical protein
MDEDWELLLASPKAAPAEPYAGGGGDGEVDAGAIKHDYFDLGSDAKYPRRASPSKGSEEECAEEGPFAASDNAGWVEPDPDDLLFPGRDRAALWSDSSSDGERPEVEVEARARPSRRMRRQSKAVARVRLVLDEKVTPSHHLPCTRLAPHLWISPSSRACWFFLGRLSSLQLSDN